MTADEQQLEALRKALTVSPDNVPLRLLVGETLLGLGRPEEAEEEYRLGLSITPQDTGLRLGLAHAFYRQGKYGQALVIAEDVIGSSNTPAAAYLLHSRLLFRTGDVAKSVIQYRKAIEFDPSLADPEFSDLLRIKPGTEPTRSDDSDYIVDGRMRAARDDFLAEAEHDLERPLITFKDVGGMEAVKDEIGMKIILPLKHPDLYKAYGKATGGGILLYGPPGCGKTYLARATAGEINAAFIAVGINDVLDMWIGNSERNLHEIFEQARRNKPCVLFFDEVDALGASRSDMRHSGGRHLINQFLAEMDGVQSSNEGILLLAATNAPWHLDPAFRRPGRFDRILFVPPPDTQARAAILRILCRGKPVGDIDFDLLSKKTESYSGADLRAVVDVAVEGRLREALKLGVPSPLTSRDLMMATGAVKPSTKEWFSTARNYALFSNQGGTYDDILKYLKL